MDAFVAAIRASVSMVVLALFLARERGHRPAWPSLPHIGSPVLAATIRSAACAFATPLALRKPIGGFWRQAVPAAQRDRCIARTSLTQGP